MKSFLAKLEWHRFTRLWRSADTRDIDEELRMHFETRIQELASRGSSARHAHGAAVAQFGDVDASATAAGRIHRPNERRRSHGDSLRDTAQDVLYSMRSLIRSPGFVISVVMTLGLGLGTNAVMFALLDTVFLRSPSGVAVPRSVRRVWAEHQFRDGPQYWAGFSYPQYAAIAAATAGRAETAIYKSPQTAVVEVSGRNMPETRISYAAPSYFSLLGVKPLLGRLYTASEDNLEAPGHSGVVSDRFWETALKRDPSVIGKLVTLGSATFTVIGVLPKEFVGVDLDGVDIWLPFSSQTVPGGDPTWWRQGYRNSFQILIRASAGTSEAQLEGRAATVLRDLAATPGADLRTPSVRLGPLNFARGPGKLSQEVQIATRLAGVTLIILLIAFANLTNLLLARQLNRRREVSVRLALGISTSRLARLMIVEGILLSAAAAVISLFAAYWGAIALRSILLPDVRWASNPFEWRLMAIALTVSVLAGSIAGLLPAFQASSLDIAAILKDGSLGSGTGRSRLRTGLVVIQSALSVLLLVGALLFLQSLENVRSLDIGFDARKLLVAKLSFRDPRAWSDPALATRLNDLAVRIAALPGAEKVAQSSVPPMDGFSLMPVFTETDSLLFPTVTAVSKGYFDATGIHLMQGLDFPTAERDAMPQVAIVNIEMARALWPSGAALGKCIHVGSRAGPCYTVIAVSSTGRRGKVIEQPQPQYYLPFEKLPPNGAFLSRGVFDIKVRGPSSALLRSLDTLVSRDLPGATLSATMLSDLLESQYRPWRLGAILFAAFGVLALIVSSLGIFGTVSYSVSQRIREFGIRLALGAKRSDLVALVLGDSLGTVATGVLLGLIAALAAGRLVAALLFGVTANDPATLIVVSLILLGVGATATLPAAWRASRADPLTVLRGD
jgi:predicted permease